jgi:hypothetical protein
MTKEAYIRFNAGVYYACEYPSQRVLTRSKRFAYALRRARQRGYRTRVFCGWGSKVYEPL